MRETCVKCKWEWMARKPRREDSRCPHCYNFYYWEPYVYHRTPKMKESDEQDRVENSVGTAN